LRPMTTTPVTAAMGLTRRRPWRLAAWP
jgi:hypothetical protein